MLALQKHVLYLIVSLSAAKHLGSIMFLYIFFPKILSYSRRTEHQVGEAHIQELGTLFPLQGNRGPETQFSLLSITR